MFANLFRLQGTLINAAAIIAGAVAGSLMGARFPSRIKKILMQGIGLAVLLIGLRMALQGDGDKTLALVFSLLLGGVTGELADLDGRLNRVGLWLERKFGPSRGSVSQAFVFATLVYGIGALAIMGSLQSGLTGEHNLLYTKSVLDGFTAVAFASTMGWGVALSSIPVLLYQGTIVVLAGLFDKFLSAAMIAEISAVGGMMIFAIGLNIMEVAEIKVGNLLPALIYSPIILWLFY